jgi:hypothetical protein
VVRYSGVPAGYEFGVIIEDLLDLSGGSTKLTAGTRVQLAALPAPVTIKVVGNTYLTLLLPRSQAGSPNGDREFQHSRGGD